MLVALQTDEAPVNNLGLTCVIGCISWAEMLGVQTTASTETKKKKKNLHLHTCRVLKPMMTQI